MAQKRSRVTSLNITRSCTYFVDRIVSSMPVIAVSSSEEKNVLSFINLIVYLIIALGAMVHALTVTLSARNT